MNLTRSLWLSLLVLFAVVVSPMSLVGASQSRVVACNLPPAPPQPPAKK